MTHQFLITIVLLFGINALVAQNGEVIELDNPSFEDEANYSTVPVGWENCGFRGESPPDIHSVDSDIFEVSNIAIDGETFVGLVTRSTDTWESIGQALLMPLEKGKQYSFELYLARAENYISFDQITKDTSNFNTPVILRIWGGQNKCDKQELLAETIPVDHFEWDSYKFIFKPKKTHYYIIFEAMYKPPVLFPYNGNLLMDNCSDIVEITN